MPQESNSIQNQILKHMYLKELKHSIYRLLLFTYCYNYDYMLLAHWHFL